MTGDRLQQFIDQIADLTNRVAELEAHFSDTGLVRKLEAAMDGHAEKLESIYLFVTGANTVFGFARKNWKTALTFGAGLMTAAGVGNPKVNAFIVGFFGG